MADIVAMITSTLTTSQASNDSVSPSTDAILWTEKDGVVSQDYEAEPFSIFRAIDLYVTPVWYIVGIPGNILAYCVWTRRRMRLSSGCYLAALAMDECLFLIMQVFFELETQWNFKLLGLPGLCQCFPVLFLTTQHLSPLLVLAFTAERYVSVCHPFHRERFCSTRRAIAAIIILTAFALSLNAIQGYFWTYDYTKRECEFRPEAQEGGSRSIWSVWSWITELFVFGVVPLVILTLNVLVINETQRLSAAERRLKSSIQLSQAARATTSSGHHQAVSSSPANSHASSSAQRPSATTLMLLAVSFYLIATTLPVTVCYVLHPTFPMGNETIPEGPERDADPVWARFTIYSNIRTIIYEIGLSHYACNFYIYLATGRMFRRELRRLLCRFCPSGCAQLCRDARGSYGAIGLGNETTSARNTPRQVAAGFGGKPPANDSAGLPTHITAITGAAATECSNGKAP